MPFYLMAWEERLVRELFGWKRSNGTRLYRSCCCESPRKSGKSSIASAIALYLAYGDGEAAPEVAFAAFDRDQASVCCQSARHMLEPRRADGRSARRGVGALAALLAATDRGVAFDVRVGSLVRVPTGLADTCAVVARNESGPRCSERAWAVVEAKITPEPDKRRQELSPGVRSSASFVCRKAKIRSRSRFTKTPCASRPSGPSGSS
jgi:Phage Terminase